MTKRERMLSAMNLETTDRPPVGFWFHFGGEEAVGQACIDAHLAYFNTVDVDFAKIMCDHYFTFPFPKPVETPADLRILKPLRTRHPFIREQVERAKRIKEGLKDDRCVYYTVFAPFSSLRFGTSDAFVMQALQTDPHSVRYALDQIAQSNAMLAEQLIKEAGMDGVYYCVQGGETSRFTPEAYTDLIAPSDLAVLKHANWFSDQNILHCCGWAGEKNHLSIWQNYPAKAVNWAAHIEDLPLPEGQAFFGGKAVLGGLDNRESGVLYSGNEDQVKSAVRQIVDSFPSNGLMIGADCSIPSDTDRTRIRWVLDAVQST